MLHDELKRGREAAGFSQTQLAARSGIPRNQIARAERGENITLDTLRKIVVHLPIQVLPLIENVRLTADFYPQPEKVFRATIVTVQKTAEAFHAAMQAAVEAQAAIAKARNAAPSPMGSEPPAEIDLRFILRSMMADLDKTFPITETA